MFVDNALPKIPVRNEHLYFMQNKRIKNLVSFDKIKSSKPVYLKFIATIGNKLTYWEHSQ